MPLTVEVYREGEITLTPPGGSIQELITELTALMNRNGVGPTAVVQLLSGGGVRFRYRVAKPD